MRHVTGPTVQFSVAQGDVRAAGIAAHTGYYSMMGRAPGLLFEKIMNGFVMGIFRAGFVETVKQHLLFIAGKEFDFTGGDGRVDGQPLQYTDKMSGHAFDGIFIEQCGTVFETDIDILFHFMKEPCQVELGGGVFHGNGRHVEVMKMFGRLLKILHHHHHIENGVP